MKILIIDDERSIRNSLKEILADEGYDVDVAENGVLGCQMVDKEKYSVIFCDIKMPEMDGMEVLDKLNEMGVDAAVVMISGHGDIDTAVECIKREWFRADDRVGICGATSTPKWLLEKVADHVMSLNQYVPAWEEKYGESEDQKTDNQ